MEELALTLPGGEKITPPPGIPTGGLDKAQQFIQLALNLFFILAILLAIFLILFSGIQWITSGGDKQKLQAARNRLTFAIVGLIVVFLAIMIVSLISFVFNVRLIGPLDLYPQWRGW